MELASINSDIVGQIKNVIEQAKKNVATTVNCELLSSYWQIGKLIAESGRTENYYGVSERTFMTELSKVLTYDLGKGFSRPNLINMKRFYEYYPFGQTLSNHLSWSHYCELITVEDNDARGFYEKSAKIPAGQSVNSTGKLRAHCSNDCFCRMEN